MVFSSHSIGNIKLCMLLLSFVVGASVLNPVQSTEVYAGLSADQLTRTTQLLEQLQWHTENANSGNGHPLGVQTLSIELAERKKAKQTKQIKVFQHNYASQSSRLVLIDLESGTVLKQQPIDSVHLPLSDAEIAYAIALVEDNSWLMNSINQEQQNRGLLQLEDLNSLDVKASVFEPLGSTNRCQRERCALLSLFDKTHTVYATEPVVNLFQGTVHTLSDAQ